MYCLYKDGRGRWIVCGHTRQRGGGVTQGVAMFQPLCASSQLYSPRGWLSYAVCGEVFTVTETFETGVRYYTMCGLISCAGIRPCHLRERSTSFGSGFCPLSNETVQTYKLGCMFIITVFSAFQVLVGVVTSYRWQRDMRQFQRLCSTFSLSSGCYYRLTLQIHDAGNDTCSIDAGQTVMAHIFTGGFLTCKRGGLSCPCESIVWCQTRTNTSPYSTLY